MTQESTAPDSRFMRFREKLRENTPYLVITLLVSLFILAYLFHRIFITVPAGHAGIHFEWLGDGTDVNNVYVEGLHVIAPWNTLTLYNLRVQEVDQIFEVLTSDGLAIEATMSIRFRPAERLLGMLHKEHGPDYVDSYLLAELGSSARRIIGLVTPSEFYSSARDSVEDAIDEHLRWELRELDEFFNTDWPHSPGYDEWFVAEADAATKGLTTRQTNELKQAMLDTFNLELLLNRLRDGVWKEEIDELGLIGAYYQTSAEFDSLKDSHQILSKQLSAVESVLSDSDDERDTGLFHLITDTKDSLIVDYYDSLKIEFNEVELTLDQVRFKLRSLVDVYDRDFMAIDIHDVLIKNIVLPPKIAAAIEKKLEQEQVALEFEFRVVRERQEAERKRVEAEGIRDFQAIVAKTIDEELLQWKGIEATLELAKSDNAKIIIVGGSDGLPLILNTE